MAPLVLYILCSHRNLMGEGVRAGENKPVAIFLPKYENLISLACCAPRAFILMVKSLFFASRLLLLSTEDEDLTIDKLAAGSERWIVKYGCLVSKFGFGFFTLFHFLSSFPSLSTIFHILHKFTFHLPHLRAGSGHSLGLSADNTKP